MIKLISSYDTLFFENFHGIEFFGIPFLDEENFSKRAPSYDLEDLEVIFGDSVGVGLVINVLVLVGWYHLVS